MKIIDILIENGTPYDRLNTFRKFKDGADHPVIDNDDFVDTNVKPVVKKTGAATSYKQPIIQPRNDDSDELGRVTKIKTLFSKFKDSADDMNKVPHFAYYKDHTYGAGTKTTNGVKISIGSVKGPNGEMGYLFDNIPKEGYAVIKELMINSGYDYVQSATTKLRFLPKSKSLDEVISDYWNVVNRVEGLGADFKSNNGGSNGTGAGSLITGKQAPFQYYKWLATNIYESVKNNYKWGFSRGGEGSAYDRYDDLLIIGITKGGLKQIQSGREAYREHVVPCDLINRMGIEICKKYPRTTKFKNQAIREVMEMIHRNLAIVLCSSPEKNSDGKSLINPNDPTEQEILDTRYQTTMPPGWQNGDSILARFKECGISVYKNKPNHKDNGKRMAEEIE